jgi:hypothetical protein
MSSSSRWLASAVALAAALGVAAVGITRNTWAVGGSDSSCYGLMADAFSRGQLQPTSPLAHEAPWPDAPRTWAPGGFIPSPTRRDAASPICSPGFALVLAPVLRIAGRDAIFVVTPLAGALLVWLTFVWAARIGGLSRATSSGFSTRESRGPVAGAAAAILTATMPIMLFQVVQPMNDVLVATAWMAVLVAATSNEPRRAWLLGVLTGLAVLMRPNLALTGLVVAIWLCIHAGWRRSMVFALASAPFVALIVVLNTVLYGHPLQSGYGTASELFGLQYVLPNIRSYGRALVETQLGVPLLGLAAVFAIPREMRSTAWLAVALSASVAAVYLVYRPFDEWWYLRFLLPALTALTSLAAVGLVWPFHTRLRTPSRTILRLVSIGVLVSVALFGVRTATERHVFDLQRLERRFRTTGEVVRDRFSRQAAFITVWQSGTVRFHADRPAVLWDSLDPASLDQAVSWLAERGLDPYILVERWEEPLFRERFAKRSALGNLDWPPRFDIERQVRIFKPSDRAVYVGGGNIPTEYVIPR